jgi:hypothetical protein
VPRLQRPQETLGLEVLQALVGQPAQPLARGGALAQRWQKSANVGPVLLRIHRDLLIPDL